MSYREYEALRRSLSAARISMVFSIISAVGSITTVVILLWRDHGF